ncbi:MAG: hypothetical protein M3Z20_12115 [Chloroflexota bacterium]|nr:hypothetical protein [Chloroflexota bacterium]
MGKEADIRAEVGDAAGEVHALLARDELILRGEIRRRFPRTALQDVTVADGVLSFTGSGQPVRPHLGDAAAMWHTAITTPPPSLRAKLGLNTGAKALLHGACDDADLSIALDGALTNNGTEAAMLVACITGPEDLAAAEVIQALYPGVPIWAVYSKGRNVPFGDSAIRETLRAHGFRDTRSCAVSARLTATRYNPA